MAYGVVQTMSGEQQNMDCILLNALYISDLLTILSPVENVVSIRVNPSCQAASRARDNLVFSWVPIPTNGILFWNERKRIPTFAPSCYMPYIFPRIPQFYAYTLDNCSLHFSCYLKWFPDTPYRYRTDRLGP